VAGLRQGTFINAGSNRNGGGGAIGRNERRKFLIEKARDYSVEAQPLLYQAS